MGFPGVKPHGNRAAKRCMSGRENGHARQRVSPPLSALRGRLMTSMRRRASLSLERPCQGQLLGRLALGIRFSVRIAVIAAALWPERL